MLTLLYGSRFESDKWAQGVRGVVRVMLGLKVHCSYSSYTTFASASARLCVRFGSYTNSSSVAA